MVPLLSTGLTYAGPAQAGCAPRKRAEVPVRLRDGFAFVPASIGNVPVTLLLDTGAQGMLLTPDIVEALHLPVDPYAGTRLLGTGGIRNAPNVTLRGLSVGSLPMADGSVPVAALPGVPRTEPPLAGLLGGQFLGTYDLDLDVPHGRMAFYDAQGCATPPFPLPYSVLPLNASPKGDVFVTVQINGESLLALVDTGSRASIITEQAAERLRLGGPGSANLAQGVDGSTLPIRHLRVRTLQVGTEVIADAPISVSPLLLGQGDMLLGLDYLGRRRVWISYRTGRVLIQ
jgi:predicted aspartyl protease